MNPTLDPGLVAVALIVIVAIVGVVLWLIAAGHLDQIEREDDPSRPTAARSPAERAAQSQRIREGIAEWRGGRGPYIRPAGSTAPRASRAGGTYDPSGQVAPAPERRDPGSS